MSLVLVTAPPVEPVSLTQVKKFLRVDHDADDEIIQRAVTSARLAIDGSAGWAGIAIVEQTWDLVMADWPCGDIIIPLPPLQRIVSVEYLDAAGTLQTLDPSQYLVDTKTRPGRLCRPIGTVWPVTYTIGVNTVTVRFVCGYPPDGSSPGNYRANIPDDLNTAILLYTEAFYDRDKNAKALSDAADAIIWRGYRCPVRG